MYRFLLRCLPPRLASSVFYRLLRSRSHRFPAYFQAAPLRYAPHLKLCLRPDDVAHQPIAFVGLYENSLTQYVRRAAKRQPGLFVDVGANYGYYTLLWLGLDPRNKVIAFEPAPTTFAALDGNVRRNHLQDRAQLVQAACGGSSGTARLVEHAQSGWAQIGAPEGEGETVKLVRLDEVVSLEQSISVLKIDAEGADWDVLHGARQHFEQRAIGLAFWETAIAEYRGTQGAEVRNWAEKFGYAFESIGAAEGDRMTGLLRRRES